MPGQAKIGRQTPNRMSLMLKSSRLVLTRRSRYSAPHTTRSLVPRDDTDFAHAALDEVLDRFAAQRATHIQPELLRVAHPGPGTLPGVMRCQRHPLAGVRAIVQSEQRIVDRQRFLGKDVEGDGADASGG